ncbi:copper chaperone PCu(A)C [Bradyrhizobium sp. 200]|uniref:copper chaperone PCu(A)C n=1 Tax=Bradyrhizobium sp. 200 TaxID=2782665 RepID=UPI001FFFBAF3|nr:copper chaperone PCu(A)C [Bradyrhizobium sp. 200]UPJ48968.1 copper chaperone PCu(A)C [Bradyrhizobium sp. 200]
MTAVATSSLDGAVDRAGWAALFGRSRSLALGLVVGLAGGIGLTPGFAAAGDALQVTSAWVPASDEIGIDLPLLMTIRNDAAEADAILRVRCPFANFSEKHTVDRGEGAPAMREVKSIPVPQNKTIELKRDGYHVMLLQTRQKLVDGETFTCAVVFQKAGTKETEVQVSRMP